MIDRAYSFMILITLGLTSIAGTLRLEWWAACAGASALIMISILNKQRALNGLVLARRKFSDPVLAFSSIVNGATIATAAFLFGQFNGWMWGF